METQSHPPVLELLEKRYSPRAFDANRLVDGKTLRSLLEAGRKSPSAFNEQPWRYIVANREDPETFERILSCLVPANQAWAKNAGVLMIVLAKKAFAHNGTENRWAFHDVGLTIMSMLVQAEHLGFAGHPMAGFDRDKTRELFAVPDDMEAVTAVAFGYIGNLDELPEDLRQKELKRTPRRPLEESIFAGRL